MVIDMELIGLLGYTGYLAILAGIAYNIFKTKTSDGVQVSDVTSAIVEAKQTFDEFIDVIDDVIKDPAVDDKNTVEYIKDAIKVIKGM